MNTEKIGNILENKSRSSTYNPPSEHLISIVVTPKPMIEIKTSSKIKKCSKCNKIIFNANENTECCGIKIMQPEVK